MISISMVTAITQLTPIRRYYLVASTMVIIVLQWSLQLSLFDLGIAGASGALGCCILYFVQNKEELTLPIERSVYSSKLIKVNS